MGEGMGGREKRRLERERIEGNRKATDREEFRFPRFSNVRTPCKTKEGRHGLRGWMTLRAVNPS